LSSKTEEAIEILKRDGLVVYPTETVYGLGGDAFSDHAVEKVYHAKHRSLSKPISIAVSDMEMLHAVTILEEMEEDFIRHFMPGPVTVVVQASRCVPDILTGGTGLIGVRMPAHETATELISGFDSPVTSTSANISGAISPVEFSQVNVVHDIFIDGGILPGTPSTVVNLKSGEIIRVGSDIEKIGKYLAEYGI